MSLADGKTKQLPSRRDIPDFILLLVSLICCVAIFFGFIIYWIRPLHTETREITMRRKSMEEKMLALKEEVRNQRQNLEYLKQNKHNKLEEGYRQVYKYIKKDEELIILDDTIDVTLPTLYAEPSPAPLEKKSTP